jgi:hypothetical protein
MLSFSTGIRRHSPYLSVRRNAMSAGATEPEVLFGRPGSTWMPFQMTAAAYHAQ